MRSIRAVEAACTIAAAALLASACSERLAAPIPPASADDAPPRRGGTLHLASFSDARSLDPGGVMDSVNRPTVEALFAGLVDYDQHANVVPDIAERWEIADEGRTYRFFLRQGVLFHDGTELTADDVKRSMERAFSPDSPSNQRGYFDDLLGFSEFVKRKAPHLDGIVVEGKYVVAFHIVQPDATFLVRLPLHSARPVCKSAGDRVVPDWQPCGAGPFKLDYFRPGTGTRIVRFDGYFRPGLPYLDAIEWSYVTNPVTQRFKFEAGQLDLLRDAPAGDLLRFIADPRWKPFGRGEPDTSALAEAMNVRKPPFDDVEVRRAVAAAIDRTQYAAIQPTRVRPLTQAIPPDIPGYDPTFEGQRYDLAAALEHMRRAGYPFDPATKTGGYPKTLVYTAYAQGFPEFTGQLLQQDLAKIGLRVELRLVSNPAYQALYMRPATAFFAFAGQGIDYPDPSDFFDPIFSTEANTGEEVQSGAFYSNPTLDDLLKRARRELDPEKRRRMYREANQIVCDDAPWAFTHSYHFYELRQPYVRGYVPNGVWSTDVRFTWVDRDADRAKAALGRVF